MTSIGSSRISSAVGIGSILRGINALSNASQASPVDCTLISATVPANKIWKICYSKVVFRAWGKWRLVIDGNICGSGYTSPIESNERYDLTPDVDIPSGKQISLIYSYTHGPNSMPIEGYIGLIEY